MDQPGQHDRYGQTASDHEMLRRYLADRDVPCPACGYNIRQLQGSTCPECGRALRLTLGVEGFNNLWITALVGALLPAGCGVLLNVLFVFALANGVHIIDDIVAEGEGVVLLIFLFYTWCCAGVSTLLLVKRQRFMRLREQIQRAIASALVLTAGLAMLIGLAMLGSI